MSFVQTPAVERRGWRRVLWGPTELRSGWRFAIYVVLFELGILAGNAIAGAILGTLDGVAGALARKIINVVVLLAAAWIMARLERRTIADYGLPWRRMFRARFWLGIAIGIGALSVLVGVLAIAGALHVRGLALGGGEALAWAAAYAGVFVIVGLDEEFRFRGYTLYTLATGVGFWPAASGLALLFGLVHLGNTGESWFGVANVVIGGLVFAALLRRSGDLWLPIGVHAGWDWAQTYLYGVADSGQQLPGCLLDTRLDGPSWLAGGSVGPEGGLACTLVLLALWLAIAKAFRRL